MLFDGSMMAGSGGIYSKTRVLLRVWSDQSLQLKLKAVSKNRAIYKVCAPLTPDELAGKKKRSMCFHRVMKMVRMKCITNK